MLISLLQKGLHYTSIEFHLNDDGSEKDCTKIYSLLEPHICEPVSVSVSKSSNNSLPAGRTLGGVQPLVPKVRPVGNEKPVVKKEKTAKEKDRGERDRDRDRDKDKTKDRDTGKSEWRDSSSKLGNYAEDYNNSGNNNGSVPSTKKRKRDNIESLSSTKKMLFGRVDILTGHESEVIACAWNPSRNLHLLASSSGDGTCRLWTVPDEGRWDPEEAKMTVKTLEHFSSNNPQESSPTANAQGSRDITAMDWSPDGKMLATGCFDGKARLWTTEGELIAVLTQHKGPIFQLQWSPNGKLLVSAGLDPSIALWDIEKRELLRFYRHHNAPALDVAWRDNDILATCSSDHTIHIYNIQKDDPVLILSGHQDEVNSVKWSPSGEFLLSSSDDTTAKVWQVNINESICELLATLNEHTQEIYTAKWNPDGKTLATASSDGTVKIWSWDDDIDGVGRRGKCLHTLHRHTQPVYAMSFSPSGRFIASGSLDGSLYVWSVADGLPIRSYLGKGGIFEVAWSMAGDHRLALSTSEEELIVLDMDGASLGGHDAKSASSA